MKFNKKLKKGFTLVELIVVIAIVAILAAVSVVSYIAFINQANLSADQQAVTQMNKIVQADVILNGKTSGEYEYAGDAVQALYRNGFSDGKMSTFSNGYSYGYSLENNKWYLLDNNDEVIYPESVEKSNLWLFYGNQQSDVKSGVTKYIAKENVTSKAHYDAGFANSTISYVIDLDGRYINIDSTLTNVTAINGLVVKGAIAGDDTNLDMVVATASTTPTPVTEDGMQWKEFKNLIIDFGSVKWSYFGVSADDNLKLINCFLCNGSNIFGSSVSDGSRYLEGCTIMDAKSYAICSAKNLTLINCELRNNERDVNIIQNYAYDIKDFNDDGSIKTGGEGSNTRTIVIENNLFAGMTNSKAHIQLANYVRDMKTENIQVVNNKSSQVSSAKSVLEQNTTISIKNNTFYKSEAIGLIRVHESLGDYEKYNHDNNKVFTPLESITETMVNNYVNNITFSGNKVDPQIRSSQYVIDDDNFDKWNTYSQTLVSKLAAKFN